MAKVNDLKAYYKELASKYQIDAETAKVLEEALGKDAVLKMFSEGFKPLPDYSADLDATRDRTKTEIENQYKDWYAKEQAKYNEYVRIVDEYKQLKERIGNDNGNDGDLNKGNGILTREEILQLLDNQLSSRMSARDANTLDYLEIRERHMSDFRKPLDRRSFEDFWKAHPEYAGMTAAYDAFIAPEKQKLIDADFESKLKAKYEEGIRDGASRRSTPLHLGQREFSPLLDQKPDVLKMGEREQDQHSRSAFFETLNNPTAGNGKA